MTLQERFWSKVDKSAGPDGCWPWTAGMFPSRYGVFRAPGLSQRAHRVAWVLVYGEIPKGACVLHRCDNPPCCNPAHLWIGSHQDNVADKVRKGRQAKGDRNGSRLHPDKRARGDRNGSRLHPEALRRGERHCRAKLTEAQVAEIRHASGTLAMIASRFGVHLSTIHQIRSNRTWRLAA